MNQNEPLKQPFFARFLESQNKQEKGNGQNAFGIWPITDKLRDHPDETLKYPSDSDEDIFI